MKFVFIELKKTCWLKNSVWIDSIRSGGRDNISDASPAPFNFGINFCSFGAETRRARLVYEKRFCSGLSGDKMNGFQYAPKMSTYSGALILVNMTWMRREWRASSAGVAIIFVLIKAKCISRSAPSIAASIGFQPTLKCSLLRFQSMQLYNEFFPWKKEESEQRLSAAATQNASHSFSLSEAVKSRPRTKPNPHRSSSFDYLAFLLTSLVRSLPKVVSVHRTSCLTVGHNAFAQWALSTWLDLSQFENDFFPLLFIYSRLWTFPNSCGLKFSAFRCLCNWESRKISEINAVAGSKCNG